MPAVLVAFVTWALGSFIARILIGASLTLLLATGFDVAVRTFLNQAAGYIGSAPNVALQLMLLSGVGTALSLLGGAILSRIVLQAGARVIGIGRTT